MSYVPAYTCDLHGHTTNSDGKDSPQVYIDRAKTFGMKVIGITDHDVRPTKREDLKIEGIRVLLGTEWSCNTDIEDVHILSYGCDFEDERIVALEKMEKESKINAYAELVNRLAERYEGISLDEILRDNEIKVEELQKKMIFEYMAKKGIVPSWDKGKIMVQQDDYLNIRREKPDPKLVIETIKELGGITVLAHPYLIDLPYEERKAYISDLIDYGIGGLEARYTYDKTSYKGTMTPEEIENELKKDFKDKVKFFTGGSDCHGEWHKNKPVYREVGNKGITLEEFEQTPLTKFC
jgi:predicted metal-dependent phosphoesterase TrpH